MDTYLGFYHQVVSRMPGLYLGVLQAIRQLKDRGYRVGIFSDKRHAFGLPELERTEIVSLVDHSLFLLDGRPYKPDPKGLLQVLSDLGVESSRALYIGDTGDDMDCARRAGVSSGAALWGSLDGEKLISKKPDFQWDRPDQMAASLSRT